MGEWTWLIALGMFLIAVATFAFGWVARILKGESASDTAKEAKSEASMARADLAAFKAEAAGRFATIEMLEKSENRVADAINRLADRLDRVLEIRDSQRPAPRSRAVKS
jgi:hypothetical protein